MKPRDAIRKRLAELQPALDEAGRLQEALDALDGKRPKHRNIKVPAYKRKREAVRFIQQNPGCRIIDVANAQNISGVRATQLLNELAAEKAVKKTPKGVFLGPRAEEWQKDKSRTRQT